MKDKDIVRGVKEKDDYFEGTYTGGLPKSEDRGYNSLAQADVVVDSSLAEIIRKHVDNDGKLVGGVPRLFNAITTAIESGSIISLKEEEK